MAFPRSALSVPRLEESINMARLRRCEATRSGKAFGSFANRICPQCILRSWGAYQQPEDLVGALLWLASPASAFTTGQTVMAEGGRIFL